MNKKGKIILFTLICLLVVGGAIFLLKDKIFNKAENIKEVGLADYIDLKIKEEQINDFRYDSSAYNYQSNSLKIENGILYLEGEQYKTIKDITANDISKIDLAVEGGTFWILTKDGTFLYEKGNQLVEFNQKVEDITDYPFPNGECETSAYDKVLRINKENYIFDFKTGTNTKTLKESYKEKYIAVSPCNPTSAYISAKGEFYLENPEESSLAKSILDSNDKELLLTKVIAVNNYFYLIDTNNVYLYKNNTLETLGELKDIIVSEDNSTITITTKNNKTINIE